MSLIKLFGSRISTGPGQGGPEIDIRIRVHIDDIQYMDKEWKGSFFSIITCKDMLWVTNAIHLAWDGANC